MECSCIFALVDHPLPPLAYPFPHGPSILSHSFHFELLSFLSSPLRPFFPSYKGHILDSRSSPIISPTYIHTLKS